MRLFLPVVLIILVWSCDASSNSVKANKLKLDSDIKLFHNQVKRSLRQYDPYELHETESDDEERGALDKEDDVISKVDDAVGKAGKNPSKLNAMVRKHMDEFAEYATRSTLVKKLSEKYKFSDTMSLSTLRQLDEMEDLRKVDIANGIKGSKKTPDGMRRKIEHFDGIKIAPKKFLESHVGRSDQRYRKDGSRWLTSAVVSRPKEQGGGDVLLISSSNPTKGDWLLPKGGWDYGENVKKATLREVIEEGGVKGQLTHGLGSLKFTNPNAEKHTYHAYKMKASTVYDDWSESIRYRLWVSNEEAIKLLGKREEMIQVVKGAQVVDDKIKAGILPTINPKLAKVKLDMS